jgi:ankyrin repeat protein
MIKTYSKGIFLFFILIVFMFVIGNYYPFLPNNKTLFKSVKNNNAFLVKICLFFGISVNITNSTGLKLIDYAVNLGNPEIVAILIKGGANLNKLPSTSNYPTLSHAISTQNTNVTKLLLEGGSNPNFSDSNKVTHLMFAATLKDTNIVAMLIKAGADIEAKDFNGETAIFYAVKKNNLNMVKFLLKYPVNPYVLNKYGVGIIHIAASMNLYECLNEILKINRNVDFKSSSLRTAVFYAGNLQTLKVLIRHGANLNHKDINRMNPLSTAILAGKPSCVQLLLEKNPDHGFTKKQIKMLYMYSKKKNNEEIVLILKELLDRL